MTDFDLVTIGAGSGGIAASRHAAAHGARVAICEESRVGGTCVIRGCIPKKLLMYAGQLADGFAEAESFGWAMSAPNFDLGRFQALKERETCRLEALYEGMLSSLRVALYRGSAQVIDAHTVRVGSHSISADRILVATGAQPHRPAIPGIDLALTSNELLDLGTLPERLLVLGSGYIAVEFASIFRSLGSEVTLAFRSPLPLRGFDDELRRRFASTLAARGIRLVPQFVPSRLDAHSAGIRCRSIAGDEVSADVALNAMGRRPNSRSLGLEDLGIRLGPDGAIPVDRWSRTAVRSIFAIGDVTDRLALTPVAIAEGRAFVDSELLKQPREVDHSLVASAVFSIPPVASVGLTEQQALVSGLQVSVFESDFRPMKNAACGRSENTYMKLIVDKQSDRVLGLHMLGIDAPEIVQSLAVAVTLKATKRQFDATMAVHPTAAEEFVLMRTPRTG